MEVNRDAVKVSPVCSPEPILWPNVSPVIVNAMLRTPPPPMHTGVPPQARLHRPGLPSKQGLQGLHSATKWHRREQGWPIRRALRRDTRNRSRAAIAGERVHQLEIILCVAYNEVVAWNVEVTDEFKAWWNALIEAERISVERAVLVLEGRGPHLPFPYSSGIGSSRHSVMR